MATTAKSLEQTLIALEQRGGPMPGSAHPVLARAVAALAMFVARIKAREPFTAARIDRMADAGIQQLYIQTASPRLNDLVLDRALLQSLIARAGG